MACCLACWPSPARQRLQRAALQRAHFGCMPIGGRKPGAQQTRRATPANPRSLRSGFLSAPGPLRVPWFDAAEFVRARAVALSLSLSLPQPFSLRPARRGAPGLCSLPAGKSWPRAPLGSQPFSSQIGRKEKRRFEAKHVPSSSFRPSRTPIFLAIGWSSSAWQPWRCQ